MSQRTFKITNALGLHLRAATAFVQTANRYRAEIDVQREHLKTSGKSLLGLLGLGATQDSEIEVIAEGPDAEEALTAIADLIQNRFGLSE